MPIRKMLKSKKAISPILATLLLIVIAVAAIVVTYAWVMTYMSAQTGQAGVLLNKDAVSWPSGSIILYVRNTGTSDAIIDAIYVGISSTNLLQQTNVTYYPLNKVVAASGGNIVNITVTYSWSNETTYYFKVAPKVGAPLEFNVNSPSAP